VNFTVTNFCNAKCVYCSFYKEQEKKYVSFDEAVQAIDYLSEINTGVLSLTGGEPLLNPDLPEIVKYARNKGLIVYTGTNSIPLSEQLAKDLARSDISAVWISFESSSYKEFDLNRGVPKLHMKVKDGLASLRNAGINTFAISLINKSIRDYFKLTELLIELGFDKVKFDYPIDFKLESTYKGWSTSNLLKFNADEMKAVIHYILKIRKEGLIKVINPEIGLLGAVDYYYNKPPKYSCYAGNKILYLDTKLDIFRCPALPEKMGHVGEKIDFTKIDCNKCYYQGTRDFDAFYYLLEKFDLTYNSVKKFDPRSIISLFNDDDLKKIVQGFKAAWDIRESELV
jgi:MoaA/NifB/PqqE/SkfB family radical SAM enzyme